MAKKPTTEEKPKNEAEKPVDEPVVEEPKVDLEPSAEETIKKLKADFDEEKRLRLAAESRTAAAESSRQASDRDLREAARTVEQSQLTTVVASLDSHTRALNSAKEAYAAAASAGKWGDAANAQADMIKAQGAIAQLDYAKTVLEAKIKADAEAPVGIERDISNYTEPAKAWLRAHPEYVTDTGKRAEATRVHHKLLGEGIAPDTQEYFRRAEEELGIREAPVREERKPNGHDDDQDTGRRELAPPSRQGSNDGAGSKKTGGGRNIRLDPDQREMAKHLEMTDAEYAKYLDEEVKAGRISPDKVKYVN